MKNKGKKRDENEVRMELKYCEHCGGLWLRECGAGLVYCDHCRPKVNDLPAPKKRPTRVTLPVRQRSAVEGYGFDPDEGDGIDLDAVGGVA